MTASQWVRMHAGATSVEEPVRRGDVAIVDGEARVEGSAHGESSLTISLETGYRLSPRGEAYPMAVEPDGIDE